MRTVPGEMIGREIQKHGGTRMERLGRGELIAGELGDEPLSLLAPINLVDGSVADVADRDAVEPRGAQQIVSQTRDRRLTVGAGDRAPAFGRQQPCELGLAHDLGAGGTRTAEKLTELGYPRARDADIERAGNLLGAVDESDAGRLESGRALGGGRRNPAIHGDGRHTLTKMRRSPRGELETRAALSENEQRELLRQGHRCS